MPRVIDGARFAASIVLVAISASACAPATLLPYRPDQPLTVNLPAARAGVTDARAAFGELFAAELRAAGDARPTPWLHRPPASSAITAARPDPASTFASRAGATSVLVAGGLFGDCLGVQAVPFGDGVERPPGSGLDEGYRQYADLGLRSLRLVPLPGRASAQANGRLLADALRVEAQRPGVHRIVLLAYSKGATDALHALDTLRRDGALPEGLLAVVSVAGAVMGTPLADFYQAAYDAISPWVTPFECTPSQGGDMESLTRRARLAWLASNPLPAGVAYYTVVAHAPVDEMAPPLRLTARQLAAIDPRNDGQLIAADAVLPNSTLLAEARADHWDVAIPRDRDPNPLLRATTSGRGYPREALFRAILKWVVATMP
jgi:hypothetical protein